MRVPKPCRYPLTGTLLVVSLAICLAACAPAAATEAPAEPAQPAPDTTGQSPLQVWIAVNKNPTEIQSALARRGQEFGLELEFTFTNTELIADALQDPHAPDLVVLGSNAPIAYYASSGWLTDLSSEIDQGAFLPALVDTCSQGEKWFCIPWGADFQVLLWNKDLFAAAALDPETPPTTLEQLTDFADRLTRFGPQGRLEQLGFLPILSPSQTSLIAHMFGGYWVSQDGLEITADDPLLKEALLWEQQFYFKYSYENVVSLFPYAISLDSDEHPFYTGELAMVIADWNQASLEYVAARNPALNFGVAPVPPSSSLGANRNPLLVDGAVLVVPLHAQNPEQAVLLLKGVSTPEALLEAAANLEQFPTSQAAVETPGFQGDENNSFYVELLTTSEGVTATTTPLSPGLESALLQIGELVLYQGADPGPLLAQVQSEFAPRLEQIRP